MTDKKDFSHILSPIKIGPVELKNRIMLAPMNETMSGVNGEATEQMISYFAARAKGGTALVCTGAIMGTKSSVPLLHRSPPTLSRSWERA